MTITQIVCLIHVLWNYEPGGLGGVRNSRLPTEINLACWRANDKQASSILTDYQETDSQIRWAKDAWDREC